MKRLIAILLSAVLLIACLPLTAAAAKETSIEQKFRLLLEDMEIAYGAHRPDSSYYKELAQNDAWVLFRGGMNDPNAGDGTPTYRYATVGNKLIASHIASEPFKSGYGVYDKGSGAFYDLTVAWERGFGGLYDAWNALPSDAELARECSAVLIGDADGDGKVNILDATRIQRVLAKLDADTSPGPDSADFFYGWPIAGVCDYDRDGKVTVLDATSIQRCLVSLPKVLDFEIGEVRSSFRYPLNPEPYTSRDNYKAVELMTTRAQIEAYADAYADRGLIAAYTDEFFTTKALVGVCDTTTSSGFDVIPEKLSLDPDGTLTAEVLYRVPEGELGLPAAFENHFILLEINRAFIGDVRSTELKTREEWPENTAVCSAIDLSDRMEAPADLNANGWHRPDAEKITVSAPYHDDMGEYWSEKLPAPELNNCDGYVLLIPSRAALEEYLPGFDSEGQYDDAFFERYAILGMIGQGSEQNDTAELDYIAVKGDTLYAYAYIQSHYATDEWGEPVLEPTAPVVWTFRRVSKSDVEGVSQIGFWRYIYPAVGGAIYLTQGSLIEQYADASGFIREESEAILINRSSDVAPAIEGLYLDEFGSSVERGDHRFEVESWTDSDFEARSVIALRVYADDLQKETFSVTGVKRTGEDELTVSIQRSIPADHDLNEGVRFIFVAIPNYGKDHTVKVNITDIYENYNGFKVNFYTDGVTGEKTAGIRGYAGDNPRVTIPDHFGDYTVTSIAFDAFSGNRVIETVTIPDTVTAIGESAFKNCVNLKRVSIPLSVKKIPNFAFKSCKNLLYVNFYPAQNGISALTSIGNSAFYGCESLSYFLIPDSVTRIADIAFAHCKSLTSVTLPQGIKEIWNDAFVATGEGFTIYGYKNTVAQLYAEDYGFAFVPLDGTGELDYTVIDRRYPSAKMTYPEDEVGLYVTSPEELAAALDTLYLDADNVSQRPNDPEPYSAESLDEEWFKTHDLIAVRTLNEQWERIGVNEIYAGLGNVITVSLVIQPDDYTGDDPEGNWCYLMIGIDKRDLGDGDPQVTVNVGYYPEPLKPIIYLYPTEETELTVTLGKPDELTCTYPAYGDGWHVTAQPDGTLIGESGRSYYALYWESKSKTVAGMNDGFVVKGEDTAKFFEEKLAILGLSEREAQEFIVYWLPLMQDNPYNLIRFATAAEIDQIMPLRFSVQPDSVIRILMEYKPLEEPVDIPEQTLSTPERRGFVAVEWGGTVMK